MSKLASPVHLHRRTNSGRKIATLGLWLYASGTAGAGLFDFVWRDFEAVHQPIGALGDYIPGRSILALVTAIWMIGAGTAILAPRTARSGAVAAAAIYTVFASFWLPRFYTAPLALGFSISLAMGLLAGIFTQLIVATGGLILYRSLSGGDRHPASTLIGRLVFGSGAILFGLAHIIGVQLVARMVPRSIPLGGAFWVVVSGAAFGLAGIAILRGTLDVLAARLLGLMLLIFEPLVLLPNLFANLHNHIAWGANAYNVAAAGAVFIFAASLDSRVSGEAKEQFFGTPRSSV